MHYIQGRVHSFQEGGLAEVPQGGTMVSVLGAAWLAHPDARMVAWFGRSNCLPAMKSTSQARHVPAAHLPASR